MNAAAFHDIVSKKYAVMVVVDARFCLGSFVRVLPAIIVDEVAFTATFVDSHCSQFAVDRLYRLQYMDKWHNMQFDFHRSNQSSAAQR